MIKQLPLFSMLLSVAVFFGYGQNQRITQLSGTGTPAAADLLYVVINPGLTPISRKLTTADLFESRTGNQRVLTYASLSAAVTAIGSTRATVEVRSSAAITADLTIPINITTVISGTGQFNVSSTKTLTISGPLIAPMRQVFTGSGTVRLGDRVERAHPHWWGAKADSRHFDTASMNSGSAKVTITGGNLTSADIGKTCVVKGAGRGGVPLITTISGVTNSTTAALAASASTTVSNKRAIIGTNDSTPMAAAVTSGAKEIYFRKSNYLVRMTATGGGAVSIPSNTTITGDGPGSVVYVIGSDGKDNGNADDDGKSALYIADGSKKINIENLKFIGENGPYTEPLNNSSNVIFMPGVGKAQTEDVLINRCYFEDLFGFPVHNAGTGKRIHITYCAVKNCANGLNVNADYSHQTFNSLDHCEGIEASGAYSLYTDNMLNDCGSDNHGSAAMSIGGRTTVGDLGRGSVVARNRIVASRSGGIVLSDGFVEGQCIDNYVLKSYGIGIQQVASSGNTIARNTIARNTVISCGNKASGNPFGIAISNGNDTKVIDNDVRDQRISGYTTTYAILDSATRTHLDGNTASGTNKDFALNGSSTQFGQNNQYDRGKIEMLTGNLASPVFRGKKTCLNSTATGIVEINLPTQKAVSGTIHYRLWNELSGELQSRSGIARFSAVNKGGSYTTEIVIVSESASISTGTLTATWSITTGANKITIKMTANSSVFAGAELEYTIQNESSETMVIL
jgi:hypothetical protein